LAAVAQLIAKAAIVHEANAARAVGKMFDAYLKHQGATKHQGTGATALYAMGKIAASMGF
jgi:hypothetical protein